MTYPGEAFSSCQMVCPTTRLPAIGNLGRRFVADLPDYCRGAAACGDGAPELNPPDGDQQGHESCGFYLRLRHCFTDCSACSRNRLAGYARICSGIRGLSNGGDSMDYPGQLPDRYLNCSESQTFNDYADGMMFCLQAKASQAAEGCLSCDNLVNGLPDIDIESGIIGSHTECNSANDFCAMANVQDGMPLRCFGAALGRAWGSILGHHSPLGAIQAVGICHLVAQLIGCANGDGNRLRRWQGQICEGYVDGCMVNQNLGDSIPQCTVDIPLLLARGMTIEAIRALLFDCNQSARRRFCQATCPTADLLSTIIRLLGELPLGERGALAFERICNRLVAGDLSPFGGPVILGLPLPNPLPFPFPRLPGFDSGRDPCLTY
jgi:hypothetical protein